MGQTLEALFQELKSESTSHQRRLQIGLKLENMGDPRPGIGVKYGLPDIAWQSVAPGGKVRITRKWEPESPGEEERTTHIQYFEVIPFYIARHLVTYTQYQAFVEAEDGFNNPAWWQGMPEDYQPQQLAEQRTKQFNNPRDGLSWYQSTAFARWLNHRMKGFGLPNHGGEGILKVGYNAQVRLPTEWEWQWAAQNGSEERRYPWGEKKPGYANTVESGLKQAIAVGMYPHGASASGALDMTGNLMEWCANDKMDIEVTDVSSRASKVLRGGDWGYSLDIANCTRADDDDPDRIDILNGCRLVLGEAIPTL